MVYRLRKEAEAGLRKLAGFKLVPFVEAGIKFVNGERVDEAVAWLKNRSDSPSTTIENISTSLWIHFTPFQFALNNIHEVFSIPIYVSW